MRLSAPRTYGRSEYMTPSIVTQPICTDIHSPDAAVSIGGNCPDRTDGSLTLTLSLIYLSLVISRLYGLETQVHSSSFSQGLDLGLATTVARSRSKSINPPHSHTFIA